MGIARDVAADYDEIIDPAARQARPCPSGGAVIWVQAVSLSLVFLLYACAILTYFI